MLTYDKAKKLVQEYLNKGKSSRRLKLTEPGIEIQYGWIFYYDLAIVTDPKVKSVESKIMKFRTEGKSEDEILSLLTSEEIQLESASVGLAGNIPVFIDKETLKIEHYAPPIRAIVQSIREKKTGNRYSWDLNIKKSEMELKTVQALYKELNVYPLEFLKLPDLLKKIKQGENLLSTKDYLELLYYIEKLEAYNISYEIIEHPSKTDSL